MNEAVSSEGYPAFHPADRFGSDNDRWIDSGNSLRKAIATILRNRLLIGGCVVVALLMGVVVTLLTKPTYAAHATFEVQPDKQIVGDIQNPGSVGGISDKSFLQTQLTLLQSRALAAGVVDSLNLSADTSFVEPSEDEADASPEARKRFAQQRRNQAIARVRSGLAAEALNDSTVIQITYRDSDPRLATRVANAAMDEFFKANIERGYAASSYARNFLGARLSELKGRLESSERELIVYASENGILAGGQGAQGGALASQSLASSALSSLLERVSQARAERVTAEQSWRLAVSSRGRDLPVLQDDREATALKDQIAALESEYQQKRATFLPDYGPMKELQSKIDRTRVQLARINEQNIDGLRANFDLAKQQAAALEGQLNGLQGSVFDTQNRGIQFATLQREVDTNRALYDALLQRYKEIGAATGSENDLAPVDKATMPGSPESPIMALNLLVALILGLAIGVGAAFIKDMIQDKVSTPEDVETKLHLPLLGTTPNVTGDIAELLDDRSSPLGESYFSIQTALRLASPTGMPKSILIVSCETAEGKTTTALGLAGSLAARGLNVLLIDADLRRPSLHRQLDLRPEFGLANVTAGTIKAADAIVRVEAKNFDFMAAGPIPPNPAQLLAIGLARPLAELKEKYDTIVIDSAPVLGLADAPIIADLVDGCVFVMEAGRSRPTAVKAALKRLANARGLFYGIVLTKFNRRLAGYGYDYETYRYAYGRTEDA